MKILSQIGDLLRGDRDSEKALELLNQKIEGIEDWPEISIPSAGVMEIPVEIAGKEGSFAVFSDGACRGNPGPGAWGSIGQDSAGRLLFESSGVEVRTTNNRMEMEAAIQALNSILYFSEENDEEIKKLYLYSDSKYVVDGMKSWIHSWKKRGWKKSDNKPPENVEFWQRLDELSNSFKELHFVWVKGHSGHPQNERCDQLANEALDNAGF